MDEPRTVEGAASLPLYLTSLVGREDDVAQVRELLLSGQTRLLTLTGPGGVGKTRLALQVAASSRGNFEDGVFFVSLAPIRNPDLVLPTIAQTLGVPEVSGQPLQKSLCSALGSKRLLLILDNFEQIVSAATQVIELLVCAPRLQVLVTSRAVLHVYGEQEYSVSPLALPGAAYSSLEQLTQYEAVRLFIERARSAKPRFAVNNSNAPAVAEICHRLDGLPLAIELAAARIKLISPQALLQRLDHRLPLLTGGATDLPRRHQTLRDAIAWSYDLLSEDEKWLFRRLSVFVGGCTLEAAEAICGDSDLGEEDISQSPIPNSHPNPQLDALTALVDKSLLKHEEQDDGEPRFMMLETIREFALEQLVAAGEEQSTGKKHTEFFLTLAERTLPELSGANQALWLDRLALEYDNLRAGFGRAQTEGDAETGLRLGWAMWPFWYIRGYRNEGQKWLSESLAQGGHAPVAMRARAFNTLGNLSGSQGDYEAARNYHKQSLALWQEAGDKRGVAVSLNNLGNMARLQGDYASARTLFEQGLPVLRELGSQGAVTLATALINLGAVIWAQGETEEAVRLCEEALYLQRAAGEMHGTASTLHRLGLIAASQRNLEEARAYQEESLHLSRRLGDRGGMARSLCALGEIEADQEEYQKARTLLSESLRLRQKGGNKRTMAESLHSLAVADREESDAARLVSLFAAVVTLYKEVQTQFSPREREFHEKWLAFARARLDPETFAAAWDRGLSLPLAEAVALALGESPSDAPAAHDAPSLAGGASRPGSDLTPREVEVLQLVAAGLTNPAIAAHLHLSINTVQTHLRTIFSKINVNTRGAAVRYAFEHSLS